MGVDFVSDPVLDIIILLVSFCAVLIRAHVRPEVS